MDVNECTESFRQRIGIVVSTDDYRNVWPRCHILLTFNPILEPHIAADADAWIQLLFAIYLTLSLPSIHRRNGDNRRSFNPRTRLE